VAVRGGQGSADVELQMYVGRAEIPRDVIEDYRRTALRLVIEGGVPGDMATPAILVNRIAAAFVECRPACNTMRTLGIPRATA